MLEQLISQSEPWLEYAIRLNLLGESQAALAPLCAKALDDGKITRYLSDVASFHSILVTNHKNPELPIHKLLFLLDLGFDCSVPQIQHAIESILNNKDSNGVYLSMTNIPKHFGGTGEDSFSWCLCDAPLLLTALVMANVDYESHIRQGVEYLSMFARENGFPCTVSKELGTFRGPGKRADCCPYATLSMLNLYSHIESYKESEVAHNCVESLLSLWEHSRTAHPYMFYMGTDFRKLKAPSHWYDLLSVANCLSKFKTAHSDARFVEMISLIQERQMDTGLFVPESVYQKCKDWDFGQKKAPSPYLTYLCLRLMQRLQ